MSKLSRAYRKLDPRRVAIATAMARYKKAHDEAKAGIQVQVSQVEETSGPQNPVHEVPGAATQSGCATVHPA
jgi:hypothetical protein